MLRDGSRCQNQVIVNIFYRQLCFERNSYCLACTCIVRSRTKYPLLYFSKLRTATHSHGHHTRNVKTYKTMFHMTWNEGAQKSPLRSTVPLRSLLTYYICVTYDLHNQQRSFLCTELIYSSFY
jgi:hypothetical protein